MFNIFRRRTNQRFIDRGRVFCPNHGSDIDVEECVRCQRLIEFNDKVEAPFLRCEPNPIDRLKKMWV